MLKRFWAMSLVLVMVFAIALTACSKSDDNQTVGEAQQNTNNEDTKEEYQGEKVLDYYLSSELKPRPATNVGTTRYHG